MDNYRDFGWPTVEPDHWRFKQEEIAYELEMDQEMAQEPRETDRPRLGRIVVDSITTLT